MGRGKYSVLSTHVFTSLNCLFVDTCKLTGRKSMIIIICVRNIAHVNRTSFHFSHILCSWDVLFQYLFFADLGFFLGFFFLLSFRVFVKILSVLFFLPFICSDMVRSRVHAFRFFIRKLFQQFQKLLHNNCKIGVVT